MNKQTSANYVVMKGNGTSSEQKHCPLIDHKHRENIQFLLY